MTFWMSHSAVGIVKITTVFCHLMLVIKMISEHGLHYTVQYVRQLQQHILRHIKCTGSESIDSFLITPQFNITHRLDIEHSARPPRQVKEDDKKRDRRKTDDKSALPFGVPASKTKAKPKETGYVCFLHHPAADLICKKGLPDFNVGQTPLSPSTGRPPRRPS